MQDVIQFNMWFIISGSSLICWKRTRMHFASFPGQISPTNRLQNEEWAKLVCLPPEKSILHRWIIYSWIENLSSWTDKLLLLCCRWAIPNYYHSRTQYYNDLFLTWWNNCFPETFKHLLPCLTVTSTQDCQGSQGTQGGWHLSSSQLDQRKVALV